MSSTQEYILNLAKKHQVSAQKIALDALAETITSMADDNVVANHVEDVLVSLKRAGVLTGDKMVQLYAQYLREA